MSTTPEIRYDLKTGYPDLALVPREKLSALATELFTRDVPLQYPGHMVGDMWTCEQLAHFITETSTCTVTPDEIQITAGAINGTDQLCRYLTKPGDIVLVENPTFYWIIHKLELSHVEVMGVPMQSDGIDLDALEALCKEHGDRISMFYAIPAFQNPTGICYSEANRRKLLDLAHKYDFTIVEDATYQYLYFDAPPPPMIRELDDSGRVIALGSTAKLVMPSLRIGWTWSTPQQAQEIAVYKTAVTSTINSQMLAELIARDEFMPQIHHAQSICRRKHDIMVDVLQELAPDWLDYKVPNGGYFVWATLPDGITATEVLAAANAAGVDFAEGKRAFVRGEAPDQFMRLCFAMQSEDVIAEGTRVLCEVLRDM